MAEAVCALASSSRLPSWAVAVSGWVALGDAVVGFLTAARADIGVPARPPLTDAALPTFVEFGVIVVGAVRAELLEGDGCDAATLAGLRRPVFAVGVDGLSVADMIMCGVQFIHP